MLGAYGDVFVLDGVTLATAMDGCMDDYQIILPI